jgi:hypothetical protein
MKAYFFSRHTADSKMVEHLGGKIAAQYTGTISGIKRQGDFISFVETLLDGGEKITHTIESESIVVAVCPLPLQIEWLKTGVTLLIPQTKREVENGSTIFSYCGLVRTKKIEIVTEQWAGEPVSSEQKHLERVALNS